MLVAACASSSTTQVVGGTGTGGAGGQDLSCRNYCTAINTACAAGAAIQYKSDLSCMNSCPAFPSGTIGDTSNNSLGCRYSHALAAASNPDQNCAAAGPSGGGVCGTNCDAYCFLMAQICPSVYEDLTVCNSACITMVGVNDTAFHTNVSGDTLQCRIYHATFAAEGSPDIHCVHASPLPALPCATP